LKSNDITFQNIWDTLREHDVTPYVEKIPSGNFQAKYITWTAAWKILMKEFPNSNYEFHDTVWEGEGYASVSCTVTIENHPRYMWLPVMDNRHNAKKNPTTRDISDARMRCLVKCLAMFGLGIDLYSKEELPDPHFDDEPKTKPEPQQPEPQPEPEAPKAAASGDDRAIEFATELSRKMIACSSAKDLKILEAKNDKGIDMLKEKFPGIYKPIKEKFVELLDGFGEAPF
jgi:hypothetical protein